MRQPGLRLPDKTLFRNVSLAMEYCMHIHVANLPRDIDEAKLRALFGKHGTVASVKIEMDKISGKPTGFAFVEMSDDVQAKAAIEGLRGKKLTEYPLALKEVDAPASGKPGQGGKAGHGHKDDEPGGKGSNKGSSHRAGGGFPAGAVRRGGQRGS
jgi:RNA recognition motif-containing protein